MKYSILKKRYFSYFLLFFILTQIACQKDSSKIAITSFTVTQSSEELHFTFSANTEDVQYYEISYSLTSYNSSGGGGYLFNTNEDSFVSKKIDELSIFSIGNLYTFYIKVVDNNNVSSEWFGPKTINVGDFCESPYNLSFLNSLSWQTSNNSTTASYYQISYGTAGFNVDSGTIIQTNNTWNAEMVLNQGTVYDFYVRGYCNSSLGFSSWEGPLTHYASANLNVCNPPSNLAFTVVRNGFSQAVGATCTWDDNGGNNNYEVNMVGNGALPTTGNIETATSKTITYLSMTQNSEYDFYVRSVCSDGSKTTWVGPLNVNIGQ